LPNVILSIGQLSFPVTNARIQRGVGLESTAVVEMPLSQFLDAGPTILSEEARITIDSDPQFTGVVDAVRRRRNRLKLYLAGPAIRLREVGIGAQWGGFSPQETMYLILRSTGWPADRIEGLPKDDEPRWFDSIFVLQGLQIRTELSLDGCRLYRLSSARDPHERNLLNSALGRVFADRAVARVKVVANEWSEARDKALQRAIELLSWLDFTAATPFAFTPAGKYLLTWRRRHARGRVKLGLWQSIFDLRRMQQWVSRPEFQQPSTHRLGPVRARRISRLTELHQTANRLRYLREALRWLYIARQSTSNVDRVLAGWYALEFCTGSETLDNAFSQVKKNEIRSALGTVPDLTPRQFAILSRAIDNLNMPTFKARFNSALQRTHLQLNESQLNYVASAQRFRNSILHGGQESAIDRTVVDGFTAVVRLIVIALLETERQDSLAAPLIAR
jgi:hypothetical protein